MFNNKREKFLIIIVILCAIGFLTGGSSNKVVTKKDKEMQAEAECLNIARALLHFYKDTGTWPYYNEPWLGRNLGPQVDYLYGNMGELPTFAPKIKPSWGTIAEDIIFSLVNNGDEFAWYKPKPKNDTKETPYPRVGWDGPYWQSAADPWGFKYMVSVNGFYPMGKNPSNSVWCLSAGPNNIVDTPAWATETKGDDIGYSAE